MDVVGVLRVLVVGDGEPVHHVLGVELLFRSVIITSKYGVIVTVARGLCTCGARAPTPVNWEITFGAICSIFYEINFIFCGGAWLEAFFVWWLDFLVFLVGMGFVVFFSL